MNEIDKEVDKEIDNENIEDVESKEPETNLHLDSETKTEDEQDLQCKPYKESEANTDECEKAEATVEDEPESENISKLDADSKKGTDEAGEVCDDKSLEQAKREKLFRLRKVIRYSIVALLAVCMLIMAIVAGAYMAATSNGKNSHDLVTILNGTYVEENTQIQLAKLEAENTIAVKNTVISSDDDVSTKNAESINASDSETNKAETIMGEAESASKDEDNSNDGDDKLGLPENNEDDTWVEEQDTEISEDTQSEILGVDEINEVMDVADEQMVMPDHPIAYPDPNALYPLPFTASGIDYFNDALFIGDSRMEGFGMYSGVPATFYAATGFQLHKFETMKVVRTDHGKVPIFDAIPYDAFTKIYIKVGLNEMGCSSQAQFEAKYSELIARLRECEPRAIIYVHGLLPVTAEKDASDNTHNNANVNARNEALKAFAVSEKAYYLDVASAFANEEGCLPSEMTGDGIHLKAPYMAIWRDYLMNNTVVR